MITTAIVWVRVTDARELINDSYKPQPKVSEDVAKQMGHFFGVPGVPNDVFKNGFNNRLNDGIHPTRLPYNGAGSYSSTGTR